MIDEVLSERERPSRWFSAFLGGVAAGILGTFFVMVHFQERDYVRKDELLVYLAKGGYAVLTTQEADALRAQTNIPNATKECSEGFEVKPR